MNNQTKKYNNPLTATLTGITELFKKKERVGSLSPEESLDGKKILITGASSGLGLATAKALASRGGEIIMAVRSGIPEKGEEVKTHSSNEKVHMLHVDLSDFSSIYSLVEEVKNGFGQIDILICNAAVVALKGRQTKYGFDEMFSVNYLAKFILVNSLISQNCFRHDQGNLPRIIFVSSESHRNPDSYEWDSFGEFKDFSAGKTVERYGYNKLLMTTFSQELERRLNPNNKVNYSVFALCPGPVNSKIAREAPLLFQPLLNLTFSIFFRSPKKACEPVEYMVASRDLEGIPKDYLFLMSRKEVDPKAADPTNGKKLWEETEKILTAKGIKWQES